MCIWNVDDAGVPGFGMVPQMQQTMAADCHDLVAVHRTDLADSHNFISDKEGLTQTSGPVLLLCHTSDRDEPWRGQACGASSLLHQLSLLGTAVAYQGRNGDHAASNKSWQLLVAADIRAAELEQKREWRTACYRLHM